MTHPQVLSDEQIEKVTADNSLDTIHAVARAIESATLEAVRGRAVALYVEPHALEVMTQAAARDCTSNAYLSGSIKPTPTKTQALYLHPSPTQPPAQAERDALRVLLSAVDAEMSDQWLCNSYHPSLFTAVEQARAALKGQQ